NEAMEGPDQGQEGHESHPDAEIIRGEKFLGGLKNCALRSLKVMEERNDKVGPTPGGHGPFARGESGAALGMGQKTKKRQQLHRGQTEDGQRDRAEPPAERN